MPQETVPEPGAAFTGLSSLFSDFSLEVTPSGVAALLAAPPLPAETRVFITHLERNRDADTIEAARRLRQAGLRPVPHLAARRIANVGELRALLDGLVTEADVDEVLVIAGDTPPIADQFPSTIDLLRTGLLERYGVRRINVAGHPEGAPSIPEIELQRALDEKNAYARQSDAEMRIITQFVFEAAPLITWEQRIRARGNALPVCVGLAGLAGIKSLVRHARACGVGASVRTLMRQGARLSRLVRPYDPGPIVSDLSEARRSDPESLIDGIHFFPFSGISRTVAWATGISDGSIALDGSLTPIGNIRT